MAVASRLKVSGRWGQQCSGRQKAKLVALIQALYIQTKRAVDICRERPKMLWLKEIRWQIEPPNRHPKEQWSWQSKDYQVIDKLRLVKETLYNIVETEKRKLVLPWEDRPDIYWKIDFTEKNMCMNTFWFLWTFSRWIAFPCKNETAQIVIKKIIKEKFSKVRSAKSNSVR